ncbi:MAG: alpha/beta hydrolase-fold protein [Luminiphilus sp.]|jgi:enterochelin esterase-like enzyme|nr:alpha/beta hydrolase-fold protein [Luminiphilus sp.]
MLKLIHFLTLTMTYTLKHLSSYLPILVSFGLALSSLLSQAGTVVRTTIDSQALQAPYPLTIYIPDQKLTHDSTYPVVYLLHGSFGSENDWLSSGNLKSTADRLMASGEIPPTLIVMPGSKSWWLNGHNEPAENAFFEDLIPYIEASYPTARTRAGRFVAGLSAGGYGATRFALKYPELFGAAAALSPATYVPLPPKNSSAHRHPAFLDADERFDEELWHRSNYPALWEDYIAKKITVPFYINSGDHDEFNIAHHATALFSKLRNLQPSAAELRIVDGAHDWQVWEQTLPEALIFLLSQHQ